MGELVVGKTIQEEVDHNFEEFGKLLPGILSVHRGKFALMKDGQIMGYYSSPADARAAADMAFKDGLFSIQHVTDQSISLGFYTDAMFSVRV